MSKPWTLNIVLAFFVSAVLFASPALAGPKQSHANIGQSQPIPVSKPMARGTAKSADKTADATKDAAKKTADAVK